MKKRILSLALALACVLSCGAPAWAAEEQVEVQVRKDLAVTLDGKPMQFDGVYPLSEGDRLYLPLRSVGELLGKQVLWFHCPCEVEADNNSLHTDTIYLYDAPAEKELAQAEEYFAAVGEIIADLEGKIAALKGRDDLTMETFQGEVKKLDSGFCRLQKLTAPTLPAVQFWAQFPMACFRDVRKELFLSYLEPEKYFKEGYADRSWQEFRDELVERAQDKGFALPNMKSGVLHAQALVKAIRENQAAAPTAAPVAAANSTAASAAYTDGARITHLTAVTTLTELGVVQGKDDGSFDPAAPVTRAEAARLMTLMDCGGQEPDLSDQSAPAFSDTQGHWAQGEIAYCAGKGVILGRGDGTFDPDGSVTGSELAKMCLALLGYDADVFGLGGSDWEINVNFYTADPEIDLYGGLPEDWDPSQALTRDVAAQILYNALKAVPMEKKPLSRTGETVTYTYQKAARADGTPVTLLELLFRRTELPTQAK